MQVLAARARKFSKVIVRALKWTALASSVILAGAFAILSPYPYFALERLPPQERRLAIYDAFWAQIMKHYLDPQFSGVDVNRMRQEWREKAAAASSDLDLYVNVLDNIALGFPASHIVAQAPSKLLLPPPNADPKQTARTQRLLGLMLAGPGFDNVSLRRGTGASNIVGDIVPGSAADRAGIEPGWIVLAATFSSTQETFHFAGEFLRLTPEQKLQFEETGSVTFPETNAQQPDDNFLAANKIKIAYDLVPLPTRPVFETKLLPGGSSYVRFDTFADSKVIDQLLALLDQVGMEGIVIDVRRNIGGEERQLRRLLDRVLENDSYIGTERSRGSLHNWRTSKRVRTYPGPLVVLIGPITASAAEIFAAAVKDNVRGPLLGRMSNGAVLKGHYFPLPDGGQVQVPVSDFVRAGDRRIEGVGVEPDIRVIPSLAELRAGRDPVVERAVLELRNIARGDTSAPAVGAYSGQSPQIGIAPACVALSILRDREKSHFRFPQCGRVP
jgi:carboxyl-terminal processing protease